MKEENEESYYRQRLNSLGITESHNVVRVWKHVDGQDELVPVPVFKESEQGIKIYVTTLDRLHIPFAKEGARWKNDSYHITRLKTPRIKPNGSVMKYDIPKGQGTYPFFHPLLINKYESQTPIDALYVTEGFFKAFKGCMEGLDVVGVSSITHLKDKDTGKLHADLLKLIKTCKVKRVVWLTDGDCLDISHKEIADIEDLYRRPKGFFSSATTFQQLLSDLDVEKWFAHIKSDDIEGKPKGLDDLLCALPEQTADIVADLQTFGKASATYQYCYKADISFGTHKLLKYFNLDNVNNFYLFHIERRLDLKEKEFCWNGTRYKWDEEKNECKVMVPAEASDYFRVGDQYHEFVEIPNKHGQLERTFHRRMKGTIIDDHGKEIIRHVPRYKAFCNVPDHLNYQQVIHSNFNLYGPMEWTPAEEECTPEDFPTIYSFIQHIFGMGSNTVVLKKSGKPFTYNYTELGLDYLQLLYQRPTHILPILCLVSKENNTGKSTLAKLLKLMFTANVAIVGNAELADNFNASWASKLLVICDEAKIDKQVVVEKVKALSTADKIMMNAKGKDHVEIDFFGKFIFITNNEENFIYASDEDVRYWVIKVPVIKSLQTDMLDKMQEEIPAMLSYLAKRKMHTEEMHRGWFDPALIQTEALKKVVAYSMPTIEKELRQFLRDKFFDFGIETLLMTRKAIHKDCFNNRYEANYLEKVLKEHLRVDQWHNYEYGNREWNTLDDALSFYTAHPGEMPDQVTATNPDEMQKAISSILQLKAQKKYVVKRHSYPRFEERKKDDSTVQERVEVHDTGRPYIFKRSLFLTDAEIAQMKPDPEQEFISKNVTEATNGTGTNEELNPGALPF
jgi:hypothetical protein